MTPEQLQYVKGELARGVDEETLKGTLRQSGYGEALIAELFAAAQPNSLPVVQEVSQPLSTITSTTNPTESSELKKKSSGLAWVIVALLIGGLLVTVVISLGNASSSTQDATKMQSLAGARSGAEIYFNRNANSYAGFCRSSDFSRFTSSFGPEIECVDSPEQYRASIELNSGEFFCIANHADMNVNIPDGKVKGKPVGFGCSPDGISSVKEPDSIPIGEGTPIEITEDNEDASDNFFRANFLDKKRTEIELYYNDNQYEYTGYCQTEEKQALENRLGITVNCYASGPEYIMYVELAPEPSTDMSSELFWCIDSTGFSDFVFSEPLDTSCE